MSNLSSTFKTLITVVLGMVVVSLILLLTVTWVMPRTLPQFAIERLFVIGVALAGILAVVATSAYFYAGWREADAEQSLRPLRDQDRARYRVRISEGQRFGILEIGKHTAAGVIVGQEEGAPMPIAPVSYSYELGARVDLPIPHPHRDDDIRNRMFSEN